MPLKLDVPDTLTARERSELNWEKESAQMQIQYAEKIKAMEYEIKKLEVQWTQLFRLPQMILLLPVKFVLAFAIPISVITKKDLPAAYWEFLRG